MFKINKNVRTKKKKIVSAFSRFKSINNPFLFKKYKTNKVYPKSNPFKPSIKFEPLISIKIQKEENKYAKSKFSKSKSNSSNLEEFIFMSFRVTNKIIKII